ncbi:methionine gamma-lyase [Candidatus Thiodictyon syntrophicum]|jgi:methionine gamma-lyase|uniref:L-methionine gamma-lyase n=1 Tax=Candidatus Thiodictyon syntrophicum TaxID=1166950 RepID=A0A2K8UDH5_9GAMM|nr:methionine gamma-lyase [Candidatus Thiodictyon syntrophicum]AUB83632.1 methionine gamma-lyase [Candidatus Thiodictyon syntrophicum]
MNDDQAPGFATRAIHHGYDPLDHEGALNPPIYLNSTYAFPDIAEGQRRFRGESPGFIYSRVGNPTASVLEARLASLEGGAAGLATASGMGAITSALWTLLAAGDTIVADQTLYGCTFGYLEHGLTRLGIKVRFADLTSPAELEAALDPHTRVVFFESPANPNMRLVDIAAVSAMARGHGALTIVDNTYCTPYLQRPLELGADLVVHSATKYLGGHGDLLAGAVVGSAELIQQIRFFGVKEMTGACISALDAYLVLRGLKTLELRMERHCDSAQSLAELLAGHPAVAQIWYPGLPSFPQGDLARRQMRRPGGMIALELRGGYAAGVRFMDALRLVTRAVSLGDCETLAQHPASMTHATYAPEERARHGISEGLVRLSVGLETCADLAADLRQALAGI